MTRILVAAALAAPLTVSLQAQSLAEVARRAEEQRAKAKQEQTRPADTKDTQKKDAEKTDKPATKVYTNDDLKAAPSVLPAAATDADKKPSAAASPAQDVTSPISSSDEASWRRQMTVLREQQAYDESDCRAKDKVVTSLVGMMNAAGGSVGAGGRSINADLAKARSDQQQCQDRLNAAKKRIADLEERARVRGVPPGWLR